MKEEKRTAKNIILIVFVLFLIIRYWDGAIQLLRLVLNAASPLILGGGIAFVINIMMSSYERKYEKLVKNKVMQKARRPLCILISFLTFGGLVFLLIRLILPELINCIQILISSLPKALEMLDYYVDGWDYVTKVKEFFIDNQKTVTDWVGGASKALGSVIGMAGSTLVRIFIAFVFAVYLLSGKEILKRQLGTLQDIYLPKYKEKIHYVYMTLNESFRSFIVGQCTEAVILGLLCALGMGLFRLPFAAMIGAMVGFTALIPVAGAYIGAGVGAIMILTVDPIKAIYFLIFIAILQQVEGNLIYPRVVGKSIGLPGIWVLAAITIGGGVMGIGGMLLAVPLTSAVYKMLKDDMVIRRK